MQVPVGAWQTSPDAHSAVVSQVPRHTPSTHTSPPGHGLAPPHPAVLESISHTPMALQLYPSGHGTNVSHPTTHLPLTQMRDAPHSELNSHGTKHTPSRQVYPSSQSLCPPQGQRAVEGSQKGGDWTSGSGLPESTAPPAAPPEPAPDGDAGPQP